MYTATFKYIVFILCISGVRLDIRTPFQLPKAVDFIDKIFIYEIVANCTENDKYTKLNYEERKNNDKEVIGNLTINQLTDVNNKTTHNITLAHLTIPSSPNFDPKKPVIIFSHGINGRFIFDAYKPIRKNLLNEGSANIFYFDYSLFASEKYHVNCGNTRIAGEALGEMLLKLYENGVKNISCYGMSLGAHACGYAGKIFKNNSIPLMEKIIAIDPTGPCYNDDLPEYRLDRTDAKFVTIIHADINTFGMSKSIGHVDFYPNGGNNIYKCTAIICTQSMAINYFAESIVSKNFLAVKCSDWDTFKDGLCVNNDRAVMGYWTSIDTPQGNYYLNVSSLPKFGLGEKGIKDSHTFIID